MTNSTDIETALVDLFDSATVQAITPNYFFYDVTQNSEADVDEWYHAQELNFFTVVVTRTTEMMMTGHIKYKFYVDISYYKQADPDGSNWQNVRSAFETIHDQMLATIGRTWGDSVEFWEAQVEPPSIKQIVIDDNPTWLGTYRFIGTKVA